MVRFNVEGRNYDASLFDFVKRALGDVGSFWKGYFLSFGQRFDELIPKELKDVLGFFDKTVLYLFITPASNGLLEWRWFGRVVCLGILQCDKLVKKFVKSMAKQLSLSRLAFFGHFFLHTENQWLAWFDSLGNDTRWVEGERALVKGWLDKRGWKRFNQLFAFLLQGWNVRFALLNTLHCFLHQWLELSWHGVAK
jgi:hypothetical protein